MRKNIFMKKVKRSLVAALAAAMVISSFTTAFAYTTAVDKENNITVVDEVEEGEKVYTLAASYAKVAWNNKAVDNVLEEVEGLEGIYKTTVKVLGKTTVNDDEETVDTADWQKRFSIIGLDDQIAWSRILIGEAKYVPSFEYSNLTQIKIVEDEEDEYTIYYDSTTATVYIENSKGEKVDYYFSWATYDDKEEYHTVSEYAAMTYEDWVKDLVETDRQTDIENIAKETELSYSIFSDEYGKSVDALAEKVASLKDDEKKDDEKKDDEKKDDEKKDDEKKDDEKKDDEKKDDEKKDDEKKDDEKKDDEKKDDEKKDDEKKEHRASSDGTVYGDVNGDGDVTITDVALVRRYLAGWDVVLGPEEKAEEDVESKDTETTDTESKDTESKDAETTDTESKDAETTDKESKDAETTDKESTDTETK